MHAHSMNRSVPLRLLSHFSKRHPATIAGQSLAVLCIVNRMSDLQRLHDLSRPHVLNKIKLECRPMPNVIAALPNIGGALCSNNAAKFG